MRTKASKGHDETNWSVGGREKARRMERDKRKEKKICSHFFLKQIFNILPYASPLAEITLNGGKSWVKLEALGNVLKFLVNLSDLFRNLFVECLILISLNFFTSIHFKYLHFQNESTRAFPIKIIIHKLLKLLKPLQIWAHARAYNLSGDRYTLTRGQPSSEHIEVSLEHVVPFEFLLYPFVYYMNACWSPTKDYKGLCLRKCTFINILGIASYSGSDLPSQSNHPQRCRFILSFSRKKKK
uniref:Uncharacterized protein n=1 Tax=Glossina pallidipes TaxID=7398 RepID=A0A1A9ZZ76_GLOPL